MLGYGASYIRDLTVYVYVDKKHWGYFRCLQLPKSACNVVHVFQTCQILECVFRRYIYFMIKSHTLYRTMRIRYFAVHFILTPRCLMDIVLLIHYDDVTMSGMASQITSLTIIYSTVYSGTDQRKHQSPASLAFVRGIHREPVNSPRTGEFTGDRWILRTNGQ